MEQSICLTTVCNFSMYEGQFASAHVAGDGKFIGGGGDDETSVSVSDGIADEEEEDVVDDDDDDARLDAA